MNPELIAKITKMVLERIGEEGANHSESLTNAELSRWVKISESILTKDGKTNGEMNQGMQSLTTHEIQKWNTITNHFSIVVSQSVEEANQVRFHSHT